MTTLDRSKIKDARLVEAVRRGMLAPKVAATQVHSPVVAKKLKGQARYEKRIACKRPASHAGTARPLMPSPRFLRHVALTQASVVKHRIAAEDRAFAAAAVDEAAPVPPEVFEAAQNVGTPASGADELRQPKASAALAAALLLSAGPE